jgi:hypothetical protein
MEKCAFCKTQTDVFANNVPICSKCSAEHEHALPLMEQYIRNALQKELLTAEVRALKAKDEFRAITRDIPSGLPSPDGTQRLQNALKEVRASYAEMMKVQQRVVGFLDRGIVPDDLKRK